MWRKRQLPAHVSGRRAQARAVVLLCQDLVTITWARQSPHMFTCYDCTVSALIFGAQGVR